MANTNGSTAARENDKRPGNRSAKGWDAGKFPTKGPFQIYTPSGPAAKRYYLLDELPTKKPPKVGWMAFIASHYGAGAYKLEGRDAKGLIVITDRVAARYPLTSAVPPDLDDDDADDTEDGTEDDAQELDDEEGASNPAEDVVSQLLRRIDELEQLKAALGIEPEGAKNPGPPATPPWQTILAQPAVQTAIAKILAPSPPAALPVPQGPQLDPAWLDFVQRHQARGTTPGELAAVLAHVAEQADAAARAQQQAAAPAETFADASGMPQQGWDDAQ